MLRKIAVAVMVAVLAVFVTAPANATQTEVVVWKLPASWNDGDVVPTHESTGTFPQTYVGKSHRGTLTNPGVTLECGAWYQVDKYKETHPFGPGWTLTGWNNNVNYDTKVGGDKKWLVDGGPGKAWNFIYGGDCVPPQPEDDVVTTEWVDGDWKCNDTKVKQTRTVTTTKYKLINNEWVPKKPSVKTEYQWRTLTENEFVACPPVLKYVIVAWEMPSWISDSKPTWPQDYVYHEKIATVDVHALDEYLDENFDYGCFQIDVYDDSTTTDKLIEGKILTSPGKPNAEDHVKDAGLNYSWKFLKIGNACEAPEPVFSCEYIDGQSVKVTHEDGVLPKDAKEWTDEGCAPPPEPVYSCVWDEQTETSTKVTHESGVLPDGAIPWTEDGCEPPKEDVKVAVCEYDEETSTANRVEYSESELPEVYVLWEDGSECTPVFVDVCVYNEQTGQGEKVTYQEGQTPREYITWVDGSECEPPTEPTLEGTLFSPMCFADVPWIDYNIVLNDPDNQVAPGSLATITFYDTDLDEFGDPLNTLVLTDQPLGGHEFLWPGADAINNGDGTWTANGWPGWALVDDEWVSVGEDNFGWTRNGVNIKVEVNPEITSSLSYPPATWECTDPPTEIHNELPAPPAKPVTAEAQFAG